MNQRIRLLLSLVIVAGSAVLAVIALLRLIAPTAVGGLDTLSPSLAQHVIPDMVCAAVGLAAGLAGIALGLAGATGRAVAHLAPPIGLRAACVVVAVVTLLLMPGGMIPVAGYTFAIVVMVGVVVLTVLLLRRHPWWGLCAVAGVAGLLAWAVIGLRAVDLAAGIASSFVEVLPGMLLAAAHLLVVVALVVRALEGRRTSRGAFATWTLRHRTAITVVAACCALPYTIARASWLTPWPLLAPNGLSPSELPMVLLTGLGLGMAMLTGGVLTLGLIRPWGRRFPRWMAGLGGRTVPVALAAVPASVVATLFTAGGLDWIVSVLNGSLGDGSLAAALELVLVFPFWLWGPLLALATWGYVMDRHDRAVADRAVPGNAYAS